MYPIYIHEYKITIWWSAKCGCSTIKEIIYNKILKKNIENIHFEYLNFNPDYLNYKNIIIVRNPIDRIISCFINKYKIYVDEHFKKKFNFKEFIDANNDNNIKFYDIHHTTPQFSEEYNNLYNYCNENSICFKFDKIIKLEDFNAVDFAKEYFNVDLNINISFNKTNKSDLFVQDAYLSYDILDLNEIPSYKSFLNEDIIKKIKYIYKIDYENFNNYNIDYDLKLKI